MVAESRVGMIESYTRVGTYDNQRARTLTHDCHNQQAESQLATKRYQAKSE